MLVSKVLCFRLKIQNIKNQKYLGYIGTLAKESVFCSVNNGQIKQIYDWLKEGQISVAFLDVNIWKMEEDIIIPLKTSFLQVLRWRYIYQKKKEWNWWTLQHIKLVPPKYTTEHKIEFKQS